MKNKLIIVLCLLFGLLTSFLVYRYLSNAAEAMSNVTYQEVVVASVDIPAKTLITNEMLDIRKIPTDYVHPQAIVKKSDAFGKISVNAITAGEDILQSKIAQKDEVKSGLAYLVPQGKRAFTVAVTEVSGNAGLIKPGDRVDVAAVVNIPDGTKEVPSALVVLQNIQVLAVGKTMEEKDVPDAKTVTLAVTAEESRPLILASQKGNIQLLLRSPVDNGLTNTYPFKAINY